MSTLIQRLYRQPPRSRAPKAAQGSIGAYSLGPRVAHQADLLELTRDPNTGERYALVVVDNASRATAAVPLKQKSAAAVLKAFEKIHAQARRKGGMMAKALGGWPERLEVDGGSEFKGAVATAARRNDTYIRVGRPGRHRQQALAEVRNRTIGEKIGKLQAEREILTDEPQLEWSADLPKIVAEINAKHLRSEAEMEKALKPVRDADMPVWDGDLLAEGTVVRVMNEKDAPTDARGVRATGRRRAGDPVFSPKEHVVEDIILTPGQTPRYRVSDFPDTLFQRRELQVVDPNEKYPDGRAVQTKRMLERGLFVPQKLHGSRRKGRVVEYHVEWRGYPNKDDWTWLPRSELEASTEGKRLLAAAT